MSDRWTAVVERNTGNLVSIGTVVDGEAGARYDLIDLGTARPDLGAQTWDPAGRRLVARPAPPPQADRVEDVITRLLGNPAFSTPYNTLTAARRNGILSGIREVLAPALGGERFREPGETVEIV